MTDTDRAALLAHSQAVATYGAEPPGPVLPNGTGPSPTVDGVDEDLFSADDLFSYRTEPFTMPGGKKVHLHPLSIDEAIEVNKRALAEISRAGLFEVPEDEAISDREHRLRAAEIERQFRSQVWVAIYACRKGAQLGAARVFGPQHAEILRRNPGWVTAIQQIDARAGALTQGATELDRLQEGMTDFFGALGDWLKKWSSPSIPGTWDSCRQALAACAGSISSIARRGRLSESDLRALAALPVPEAETAPDG